MAKNGKGRPTKEQAAERKRVETWLGHIATYDKLFKKWEARVIKILERYRDDQGETRTNTSSKFNILWSNVQTLSAATFAKLPKPDVSRRFKDSDPVGRVASLVLERALDYEIQHYTDYKFALKSSVLDRFLGGRGTAWVRYEPHFRAMEQQLPVNGVQVTEDIDEPQEELDYECAPIDYVHWKDFGHTSARTWDEVTAVWRKVYMTREALVDRFGEELGNEVPLDAVPEEYKDQINKKEGSDLFRGLVYEIWDKQTKEATWLSKSMGKILDTRDDPLGLGEFFPCPKPLYSTLTNETLVPVPDFTLYQDQARLLDVLSNRIDQNARALQIKGVYNSAETSLSRLFTEGDNTQLLPVKNWAAFAEKQGLKGAIDIVDLTPIANALKEAYLCMEQVKGQIYEITGISDIVRGQSDSNATATAERIKGQFASLRLKSYQEEVAQYAAEAIQIKAQIICNKFAPETILKISAADQLSENDKKLIPQAMILLLGERAQMGPDGTPLNPDANSQNPMRSFRIDIESDSLVYLDDQENKQSRMEFLTTQGNFITNMVKVLSGAGPLASPLVPSLMEMWKFSAQAFKVGKTIEGSIDEATEQIKNSLAQAAQQPPQPNPDVIKIQGEQQLEQQRMQFEQQRDASQQQQDAQRSQNEAAQKEREAQAEGAREERRMQLDNARAQFEIQSKFDFEQWKAKLDADTKVEIARIQAECSERMKEKEGENGAKVAREQKPPQLPDIHVHIPGGKKKITRQADGYVSEDM